MDRTARSVITVSSEPASAYLGVCQDESSWSAMTELSRYTIAADKLNLDISCLLLCFLNLKIKQKKNCLHEYLCVSSYKKRPNNVTVPHRGQPSHRLRRSSESSTEVGGARAGYVGPHTRCTSQMAD